MVLGMLAISLAPLDLLLPKMPASGVVRDSVSSAPIPGARVQIGTKDVKTNATGEFEIARAALTEPIQVEADGYQPLKSGPWLPIERRLELRPRSFAIEVRDAETNEPIRDAEPSASGLRFSPVEAGRFRVEPAREGIPVTVTAAGYRDAVVRAQSTGEVVAALQPRLGGTVVDATTGRAVAGAFLTDGEMVVSTNANGTFELARRPNGPLRVLAPGYRRIDIDASQERTLVARVEPMAVKALYLTYFGVGDRGLRQNVLSLAERTEVNAVVIDVKGDQGKLTYRSSVPLAETIGANAEPTVPNIDELLASLKQRNIYTIARIVVFKDDLLARNGGRANLDVSIKNRMGDRPWTDAEGIAWVDPLLPSVWEYNVDLAREAALKGFDEVQFDAVRFPADTGGGLSSPNQARYSRSWLTEEDRVEAIGTFLKRAREEVRLAGAFMSADVSGYVAWNDGDNGVGHDLLELADAADYLCLTLHPSTFRQGLPGLLNFPQVIQNPYAVVFESVRRARMRTADQGTVFRPWLQYFDDPSWQTGRRYRTAEIDAQRNGAQAAGASGWMMWDPTNQYGRGGLGVRP